MVENSWINYNSFSVSNMNLETRIILKKNYISFYVPRYHISKKKNPFFANDLSNYCFKNPYLIKNNNNKPAILQVFKPRNSINNKFLLL